MTLPRSVAEVLDEHVTLELDCIDRMYCNLYVPTDFGFRSAVFLTRSYTRLQRHGLAVLGPRDPPRPVPLRDAARRIDNAVDQLLRDAA